MPTVEEVRARVETDLDDATLQSIIDAETEALIRYAGSATHKQTIRASGLREITLYRPATSITSIHERRTVTSDEVELAADDYRLVGKYSVARLPSGTNPASTWGDVVVVEYVPEIDVALRERVIIDLVQVSVEFRAMETERIGDYQRSETQGAYETRRRVLLSQVTEGRGRFV